MPDSSSMKQIIIFIVIGVAVYFLFFNKKEAFGVPSRASQCAILKQNNKDIKEIVKKKCDKFDEPSSRGNINDRSECYTFAGQEITSELDMNSWCDLDENDQALIDAATNNLVSTEDMMGYERLSFGQGARAMHEQND